MLIISSGLQSGDLKLLKLIEELGEYLISEDGSVRSRSEWKHGSPNAVVGLTRSAMSYLAEVLAAVPAKVLSLQQSMLHNS
jgi:DNA repair/transcription protein MET18/MMS19